MWKMNKLSVAMCTYFGESYLEEQLQSIAEQTYLPYELVVCDDCSKDRTIEILNAFSKNSPFPVRIFSNEKNLRSTKNFEKAAKLCESEIIAFADQDDVWDKTKLEKKINILGSRPDIGAVFTDAEVVDEKLNPLGYHLWESIKFDKHEQGKIRQGKSFDVLLKHNVVTGATMAFRKAYLEYVLPFPVSWVHDGWVALILSAMTKIDFIEEPLMLYRQHSKQQIGALKKELRTDINTALKNNSASYTDEMQHFMDALNRLKQLNTTFVSKTSLKMIDDKVKHLKVRANMPKYKLKRVVPIIGELASARYHRYSNGFLSVLKDLVVKI